MHQVMENKRIGDYWKNDNLPKCFIDAVQRLLDGLKSGNISDIFFPEVKYYWEEWNERKDFNNFRSTFFKESRTLKSAKVSLDSSRER